MPDKPSRNNAQASTRSSAMSATQTESSNSPSSNTSITAALFLRMAECYGSRWTSQYQEDEDQTVRALTTWSGVLSGLTSQQVSLAARAMIDRHPSWPPTLGEFVALAREFEDFTPEYIKRSEPAPVSPEAKAAVASMIEQLKANLAAGQS